MTIHELDEERLEFTARNRIYNRADALIVHCAEMKRQLVEIGVEQRLIRIVPHGTNVMALDATALRQSIVYYGGHRIISRKNIATMLEAYRILLTRRGSPTPSSAYAWPVGSGNTLLKSTDKVIASDTGRASS